MPHYIFMYSFSQNSEYLTINYRRKANFAFTAIKLTFRCTHFLQLLICLNFFSIPSLKYPFWITWFFFLGLWNNFEIKITPEERNSTIPLTLLTESWVQLDDHNFVSIYYSSLWLFWSLILIDFFYYVFLYKSAVSCIKYMVLYK